MSGLGLVANIAKDALSAQRYGMDVTAHNIANVNTDGYSRQNPVYEAKESAPQGSLQLGRGVTTSQVVRSSDQFIENQLMEQKSDLSYSKEMESYLQIMEGCFTESGETSVSDMLVQFWNLWHEVSNDPSGPAQRSALYEYSMQLSERFNSLDASMKQLESDLNQSISVSVDSINLITEEIARLNNRIIGLEVNGNANDLRDERNKLLTELSEHIDIKAFEQDDGSLTVITVRGSTLVDDNSSYELSLGGSNGDRILWQGSGGSTVDITNYVTKGDIGSALDMRDEVLVKYTLDLNEMGNELIWSVNQMHSQGIGLNSFSTVSGTYGANSQSDGVGTTASGLDFYDRIDDGSFTLWLYDGNGDVAVSGGSVIDIDADVTSLDDIAAAIGAVDANITTSISDGKLEISGLNGYTFGFSNDNSNILAAMGINTFFSGTGAIDIQVNSDIGSDNSLIAAARISGDGTFTTGDNTNALAITDLQYTPREISQWTVNRIDGNTEGSVTGTIEDYYYSLVSSIGILSASASRAQDFNETMVTQLSQMRDSLSAVSLDEEMANLVKFQHAYTAAAKLISIADEMLNTLLELK